MRRQAKVPKDFRFEWKNPQTFIGQRHVPEYNEFTHPQYLNQKSPHN